jgi:hypothetical protein
MNTPIHDKKAMQVMLEEIRTRVFEKYAENQGLQTQETELKATVEALHEMTHIPLPEIEQIAADVMHTRQGGAPTPCKPPAQAPAKLDEAEEAAFAWLVERVKRKKRAFMPHCIAFVCVNSLLIFLNLISTSFPWVLFPLLGWGIGLVSHYFEAVRWPTDDLRAKIRVLKSQIHQILQEHVPAYHTPAQAKIFNGMYRLVIAESPQETLQNYLKSVDPQLSDAEITQAVTQLGCLPAQYHQPQAAQTDEEDHTHGRRHRRPRHA